MNARLIWASVILAAFSIASAGEGTKWIRRKSEDGRFTVMFPSKPETQDFAIPTRNGGNLTLKTWSSLIGEKTDNPGDDALYYFNYIDVPKGFMTTEQYFASREEHHLKRSNGTLLGRRMIKMQGLPCLEITWSTKDGSGIARFIVAKNRHYEMIVFRRGDPSPVSEKRFFASAKLR